MPIEIVIPFAGAGAVSDVAVLAPEVAESLPDDVRLPAGVDAATSAVAGELCTEAARYESEVGAGAEAGRDAALLLRRFAEQLTQPRAWRTIDRFVHELVTDFLADALGAANGELPPALTARAFTLKALARHTALWPGAGPRPGCAYGYDSILAGVRLAALTT
jgi:hypothetical protein